MNRFHEAGILHRDFKTSNILISPSGRLHVCDFGSARWVGGKVPKVQGDEELKIPTEFFAKHLTAPTCTSVAAPPEHCNELSRVRKVNTMGSAGDAWSLACVLLALVCKDHSTDPFTYGKIAPQHATLLHNPMQFLRSLVHDHCPDDFLCLLKRVFVRDPRERALPSDLLHDPFWDGYSMQESLDTARRYIMGKMEAMGRTTGKKLEKCPASISAKHVTRFGAGILPPLCD